MWDFHYQLKKKKKIERVRELRRAGSVLNPGATSVIFDLWKPVRGSSLPAKA